MDLGLKGKIALVTGAARDVGGEIAKTLAAEGATVAVNYRSSGKEAEALVAEVGCDDGHRAIELVADHAPGDVFAVKKFK